MHGIVGILGRIAIRLEDRGCGVRVLGSRSPEDYGKWISIRRGPFDTRRLEVFAAPRS